MVFAFFKVQRTANDLSKYLVQGFHLSNPTLDSVDRYKEALRWVYANAFSFVAEVESNLIVEMIVGGAVHTAREAGSNLDLRLVAFSFITFYLSGQLKRDLKPRELSIIGIVIEDNVPAYI